MPIIQAIHDLSCAQALFDPAGNLRLSMGDAARSPRSRTPRSTPASSFAAARPCAKWGAS